MRSVSVNLFDHFLEVRENEWGAQWVLVDGVVKSRKLLGGWTAASHTFQIKDEQGSEHVVEVRWGNTGLRSTKTTLRVDGRIRQILQLTSEPGGTVKCPHCSYSLIGQRLKNGEIQCPECGRHTTLANLGLESEDDLLPPKRSQSGE